MQGRRNHSGQSGPIFLLAKGDEGFHCMACHTHTYMYDRSQVGRAPARGSTGSSAKAEYGGTTTAGCRGDSSRGNGQASSADLPQAQTCQPYRKRHYYRRPSHLNCQQEQAKDNRGGGNGADPGSGSTAIETDCRLSHLGTMLCDLLCNNRSPKARHHDAKPHGIPGEHSQSKCVIQVAVVGNLRHELQTSSSSIGAKGVVQACIQNVSMAWA